MYSYFRTVKREVPKEIALKALARTDEPGHITVGDESEIFTADEISGYGVYGTSCVYEENGKYYLDAELGTSCD